MKKPQQQPFIKFVKAQENSKTPKRKHEKQEQQPKFDVAAFYGNLVLASNDQVEPQAKKIKLDTNVISNLFDKWSQDEAPPTFASFDIPCENKGYQMMVQTTSWSINSGLGKNEDGILYPIKTHLKKDRLGIGHEKQANSTDEAKTTHFPSIQFDEHGRETQESQQAQAQLSAKHKQLQNEIRPSKKYLLHKQKEAKAKEQFYKEQFI